MRPTSSAVVQRSSAILAAVPGEGGRIIAEAQAGLACEPESGVAAAQALLRLRALSTEERTAMGQRGKAYYRAHFHSTQLNQRLEDCLSRLVLESS